MLGDDAWHSVKHKTANKRRSWRKLHLAVDVDGFIVASEFTDRGADDASVAVGLIRGLDAEIGGFTGDGAYDTRPFYAALCTTGATAVIPARKTAMKSKPRDEALAQRDGAIARTAEVGRRQWRKESRAHQQARAETAMLPYKRVIGESLGAKKATAQRRKTAIAVSVLNRMNRLGRPESVAVVA